MLNDARLIGFIPTGNAEAARHFYEHLIGLQFVSDDRFALIFRSPDGSMIRVVRAGTFVPAPFTILGWEVTAIEQKAEELASRGVTILRFSFVEQDALGLWTTPAGDKVLWFADPDGNTLSFSQHAP